MSTLKKSDAENILGYNECLPEDLIKINEEVVRFFTMDDQNIIDRAQAASQFSAFVRTGFFARRRMKETLERRFAKLQEELMTTLGYTGATQFKFVQEIAKINAAIDSGMAFDPQAARIITDDVKKKIKEWLKIKQQVEDIQLSIDFLNDMFEVSKNYSFNINTAAKLITAER